MAVANSSLRSRTGRRQSAGIGGGLVQRRGLSSRTSSLTSLHENVKDHQARKLDVAVLKKIDQAQQQHAPLELVVAVEIGRLEDALEQPHVIRPLCGGKTPTAQSTTISQWCHVYDAAILSFSIGSCLNAVEGDQLNSLAIYLHPPVWKVLVHLIHLGHQVHELPVIASTPSIHMSRLPWILMSHPPGS